LKYRRLPVFSDLDLGPDVQVHSLMSTLPFLGANGKSYAASIGTSIDDLD